MTQPEGTGHDGHDRHRPDYPKRKRIETCRKLACAAARSSDRLDEETGGERFIVRRHWIMVKRGFEMGSFRSTPMAGLVGAAAKKCMRPAAANLRASR